MYAGYGNELIYLMDLCTLSYHLHSQTLIWPMDPYYEQFLSGKGELQRDNLIREVYQDRHNFVGQTFQVPNSGTVPQFTGPGKFSGTNANGWLTNDDLDPIVSKYDRIYPWRPSFTRPEPGDWIVYNTPRQITDRIGTVHMVQYSELNGPQKYLVPPPPTPPSPIIRQIHGQHPSPVAGIPTNDRLYCFEGGTGAVGKVGDLKPNPTSFSLSLMGFVLEEDLGNGEYNVYIVFRGSRSGDGKRAMNQGAVGKGNPDWVTDMDFGYKMADPNICRVGLVARGFRSAIYSMMPTILTSLEDIQNRRAMPPKKIMVSGHSLGGALATHFTSAMTAGTNPNWINGGLNQPLRFWPWESIALISFGAPIAGNETFAKALDLFVPSNKRCFLEGDPVTFDKSTLVSTQVVYHQDKGQSDQSGARLGFHAGTPIGIKISDNLIEPSTIPGPFKKAIKANTQFHEPINIRRGILQYLTKNGFNTINVPASINVGNNNDEPWKKLSSFRQVYGHLAQVAGGNLADLQACFISYPDHCKEYLRDLSFSMNDNATKFAINQYMSYCNNPLQNLLNNLFQQTKQLDDKIGIPSHNFIKMCMLMCRLSINANQGNYNLAIGVMNNHTPEDLTADKFQDEVLR